METIGSDAKDDDGQTPDAPTELRESHLGALSGNPSQQPGVPLDTAANTTPPPLEAVVPRAPAGAGTPQLAPGTPSPAAIAQDATPASPAAIAQDALPPGYAYALPPGHPLSSAPLADLQGAPSYEGYPEAPDFADVRHFANFQAHIMCSTK